MTVSVVIAYRDMGCPWRRDSFAFVHRHYERYGWEIVVEAGDSDDTFSRATAINTAIQRASGDIIVQSDPDSLVHSQRLLVGIEMAEQPGLVVPHDRYLYLTEAAAREFIDAHVLHGGWPRGWVDTDFDVPPGAGVGNVTVFSRDTWEAAGRFDERFGMWGGDDAAFAYATSAFCGPMRRVPGDMVHLWHPRLPQSEPGHPGYVEQFSILEQYRDAWDNDGPAGVQALVRARS